jgi:2-oxoglutarate ferredoxin oxidoreductase subunit alpha
MIETVQYGIMTETPVVVAFVQRLGPSTGGATQGGQGDVLLSEFCTSGGYTIPVFAPSTARECHELTRVAFEWAERLRTPVVLLSDKEVGMTMEGVDFSSLRREPVARRRPAADDASRFATYACDCTEEPPPFAAIGESRRVVATGSAHDSQGRLRKNSPEVIQQLIRLQTKITAHADEMALVRHESAPGAKILILSYGISARAALEACRRLRAAGREASFLQLYTLFPVPQSAVRQAAAECTHVVVAEENLTGLYASVLEPVLAGKQLVRVNRVGAMIGPNEIVSAVEKL